MESSFSQFAQAEQESEHHIRGRVTGFRSMSNLSFCELEIEPDKFVQLLLSKDFMQKFKIESDVHLKTGIIISASGNKTKTIKGQDSIQVKDIQVLSDCHRPIPKVHHGLKDPESRYEKRYLDFISNPQNKSVVYLRHNITNFLRQHLIKLDFIEVETPILSNTKSGAIATPFITYHETLKRDLFLRVAPEIHLKMLTISGFNRIFEIGKNFRNEDISTRHNPEYTSCEFYAAYWNYVDLLDFTKKFIIELFEKFYDVSDTNQEDIIDFRDFSYFDLIEVFEGLLGCKLDSIEEEVFLKEVQNYYEGNQDKYIKNDDGGKLDPVEMINRIIEVEVEEKIGNNPTIILHHPICITPLANKMVSHPLFSQRFEVFVRRMEIINAYTELNDHQEQKQRFLAVETSQKNPKKNKEGEVELQIGDKEFVEALAYGMPPTAGWGIGLDRIVMLLSKHKNIKEVITFPIMNKRI